MGLFSIFFQRALSREGGGKDKHFPSSLLSQGRHLLIGKSAVAAHNSRSIRCGSSGMSAGGIG